MYNGNKITREQNKQWNNTGKHIKITIATNWKLKKKMSNFQACLSRHLKYAASWELYYNQIRPPTHNMYLLTFPEDSKWWK